MLRLIPKERFEDKCKGRKPDHKIWIRLEENISWPFFEIPESNSWFLYIEELGMGLVFGEIPSDYKIDYSDWKLEKIGEKPNPNYILNIMKSCVYLKDEFYEVVGVGEWKITNSRFEYPITFSIKVFGSFYLQTAIGYEEKLKVPMNKTEIRMKDKLIEHLGNGLRGNSEEGSGGS